MKGKTYQAHLLRRSFREDGKVKNETLGNLSHLPLELIDIIRRSLKGETFISTEDAFDIRASRAEGHVRAVALAMDRLDMTSLLGTKPSRERDLVLAMIAARIVSPATKLATARSWDHTTLGEDFRVADASEDELYAAMDWLLAGQDRIQKKLAQRHLRDDSLVLYDLSSSYFEGTTCPLAHRGTLQVNYGLMTDARGCPVAISVHETIVGAYKNPIDMASAPATIIDGVIVPDSPRKAIEAGREAQVPWMIGAVESEAAHFPEQLRVGYLATLPKPLLATLTVAPESISSSRPRRRTI